MSVRTTTHVQRFSRKPYRTSFNNVRNEASGRIHRDAMFKPWQPTYEMGQAHQVNPIPVTCCNPETTRMPVCRITTPVFAQQTSPRAAYTPRMTSITCPTFLKCFTHCIVRSFTILKTPLLIKHHIILTVAAGMQSRSPLKPIRKPFLSILK